MLPWSVAIRISTGSLDAASTAMSIPPRDAIADTRSGVHMRTMRKGSPQARVTTIRSFVGHVHDGMLSGKFTVTVCRMMDVVS